MKTTASCLDRFIQCPAVELLEWKKSPPGIAAQMGTVIHKSLEDYILQGDPYEAADPKEAMQYFTEQWPDNPKKALKYYQSAVKWWLETIKPILLLGNNQVKTESSYGFNPMSGEVMELYPATKNDRRDYSKASPGMICGTIDVVIVTEQSVMIIDWKTGQKKPKAAKLNWQMRFFAIIADLVYDKDKVSASLVKVNTLGTTEDIAYFSPMQLGDLTFDLSNAMNDSQDPTAKIRPGEQCLYCPVIDCLYYRSKY